MKLRLYTKTPCVYCDMMKAKLQSWGVIYETINISDDAEALEYIKGLGFRTVPQLMVDDVSLNAGIDTREFTKQMLDDKIELHAKEDFE